MWTRAGGKQSAMLQCSTHLHSFWFSALTSLRKDINNERWEVRKARWPIQWEFTYPDVSPTCRHCCYVFIHSTKYHTLLTCIHTYYMNSPSLPPSKKNNLSVVILKLEIESKTIRKGILRWHFTCDLWWWQGGAFTGRNTCHDTNWYHCEGTSLHAVRKSRMNCYR